MRLLQAIADDDQIEANARGLDQVFGVANDDRVVDIPKSELADAASSISNAVTAALKPPAVARCLVIRPYLPLSGPMSQTVAGAHGLDQVSDEVVVCIG